MPPWPILSAFAIIVTVFFLIAWFLFGLWGFDDRRG
jgi:hypothetical protein